MKVIYEPAKPRYHVQHQNSDGEWEYWRGYITESEARTEAYNMTALDSDNYRVVDNLQDDDPSAQFPPRHDHARAARKGSGCIHWREAQAKR